MASKNAILGIGALVVAAAVAFAVLRDGGDDGAGKPPASLRPSATATPVATMTDEERKAYVKDHVTVEDLIVDADTKPGEDGKDIVVPGLLRATGTVKNNGDKPVTPVTLVIHMTGANEEVIGSFLEDVSGQKPLAPGASRPFKFTLPDKKDWSGKFKQALQ